MRELDDLLAYLVKNVDGALAVIVGDKDGLLIEQYPKQSQDYSAVAAQWTTALTGLKSVSSTLEGGEVKEVMMTAERVIGYTRILNEELFCFIVMNPSGNIGKARLYSEQITSHLLEVFA